MNTRRKYFGTDGIRGRVGLSPMTPDFIMKLGYAAGRVFKQKKGTDVTVLIGKDTRISGYMFESALEAGLSAAGVEIVLGGPLPTPAVAFLTRELGLQAGIVVSASHNPYQDNGIKFFSSDGSKLTDLLENEIEATIESLGEIPCESKLGKARRLIDGGDRYVNFCKAAFPSDLNLKGLKLVIDCANGAGYAVANKVFGELGADVELIGSRPNGYNINDGVGATFPDAIVSAVERFGADIGISLDGDGDRVVMVGKDGKIRNGDELIYIIGSFLHRKGRFDGGVIGTSMTNLGVELGFKNLGVPFDRADVGDRYVMEELKKRGWSLGGESSGHIITLDKHTTGDGIISALQVLEVVIKEKKSLSQLADDIVIFPQVLVNVPVVSKIDLNNDPVVQGAVRKGYDALKGKGRILLRASGTEPVIRVMVEGEDKSKINKVASELAGEVKGRCGD